MDKVIALTKAIAEVENSTIALPDGNVKITLTTLRCVRRDVLSAVDKKALVG